MKRIDYAELVAEFNWTRTRHGGRIDLAAPIFGVSAAALARRLQRARKAGHYVDFIDTTRRSADV